MYIRINNQQKRSLVWGGLLVFFGVAALAETFTDLSAWLWAAALYAGGVVVLGIYATGHSEKGSLILSYVMLESATLIALLALKLLKGAFVPTFILTAIAFPFLVAFLQCGRKKWGLLIPAYTLFALSSMILMIDVGILDGVWTAVYVFWAIAAPFYFVFSRDTKRQWALIPGSIAALLGLSMFLLDGAGPYIWPAVLILAGLLVVIRTLTNKEVSHEQR
jgi:hypothetical protein